MRRDERAPAEQIALAAWALGALVLVSPARLLWAGEGAPWWSPFAAWVGLIGLCALVAASAGRRGPR
ncbi:MAG: hypothetical protein MUF34_11870 [Polyangiaceae bacterium]|nr:hypothetical protein [Polyangiaceae bacterium]